MPKANGDMKTSDLNALEASLRHGKVPEDWTDSVEGVDPNIMLIIMWAGRLSRRVDAQYQESLRDSGLKYSDYSVLSILRFSGAMSPKQLNTYLAITSGGLTKTIQRLEKRDYVKRQPDPDDGRGTLISLTIKGEKVVLELLKGDVRSYHNLLADRTDADRARIALALRDLLDAFEQA